MSDKETIVTANEIPDVSTEDKKSSSMMMILAIVAIIIGLAAIAMSVVSMILSIWYRPKKSCTNTVGTS